MDNIQLFWTQVQRVSTGRHAQTVAGSGQQFSMAVGMDASLTFKVYDQGLTVPIV